MSADDIDDILLRQQEEGQREKQQEEQEQEQGYTVGDDGNNKNKGEKKFETGKLTSKQIDSLLLQGKNTLKITRQGEGKETSYKVEAAD